MPMMSSSFFGSLALPSRSQVPTGSAAMCITFWHALPLAGLPSRVAVPNWFHLHLAQLSHWGEAQSLWGPTSAVPLAVSMPSTLRVSGLNRA